MSRFQTKKSQKELLSGVLLGNIDLIIGGHTHTFLDRPEIVTNIDGEKVIINQVGCFGLYLGQIDFYFDAMNNKTSNAYAIEV